MKRQMIAAAMLGMFVLGIGNSATAAECKQIKSTESMSCREIKSAEVGPGYCLVPENFGLRGVKASGAADPWVTAQPIKLGSISLASSAAAFCAKGTTLAGRVLNIKKNDKGDGYQVRISGKHDLSINMTATRDADGNDLWLSGTDSAEADLHYFVLFRDKSGNADLPKFLLVEALNFADGHCGDNAPSLSTKTVVKGACADRREPEPRKTGVGAGGEGHGGP
jgi:hypothetical protein